VNPGLPSLVIGAHEEALATARETPTQVRVAQPLYTEMGATGHAEHLATKRGGSPR